MSGTRVDQALVERGLCDSREKARRFILAGQVRINGQPARKPSDSVKPGDELGLTATEKFVSRGGHKLEHALDHFQIPVAGLTAIDLGASTGGFTDCLLQRGAARVFAVDVGQGQFAWKLRQDPRVVVMEKTNARYLTLADFAPTDQAGKLSGSERPSASHIQPPADLIVADCSFISLKKILPPALPLLRVGGRIVALIKPQFEAGREETKKGRGVITDGLVHQRVLDEMEQFVTAQAGLCWRGVVQSPLLGPAGNKEFLALIEKIR